MLVAANALMLKVIQALIPKQVHEKLALRYKDVKSDMVFWVQYIEYVFGLDQSNGAVLRDRDLAGLKRSEDAGTHAARHVGAKFQG